MPTILRPVENNVFRCPNCGRKIAEFIPSAHAAGVFIKCPGSRCKKIIEIKIHNN